MVFFFFSGEKRVDITTKFQEVFHSFGWFGFNFLFPVSVKVYKMYFFFFFFSMVLCEIVSKIFNGKNPKNIFYLVLDYVTMCLLLNKAKKNESKRATLTRGGIIKQCVRYDEWSAVLKCKMSSYFLEIDVRNRFHWFLCCWNGIMAYATAWVRFFVVVVFVLACS